VGTAPAVDNTFYDKLGEAWYDGENVAIAILKHESGFKNPWVQEQIQSALGREPVTALDVGCGGGFLSNYLAQQGHATLGLDASFTSVRVAARHGEGRARYAQGDACRLPFPDRSVSVVCAMDLLEHIETPAALVAEAARVLKPGGLFFFQTYNRTPLAYVLFVWAVNRTPGAVPNTHVYRLFIKPSELRAHCAANGLEFRTVTGFKLGLNRAALNALRGRFDDIAGFRYQFTSSLAAGYMGCAQKVR